jgi:hypothetical protein
MPHRHAETLDRIRFPPNKYMEFRPANTLEMWTRKLELLIMLNHQHIAADEPIHDVCKIQAARTFHALQGFCFLQRLLPTRALSTLDGATPSMFSCSQFATLSQRTARTFCILQNLRPLHSKGLCVLWILQELHIPLCILQDFTVLDGPSLAIYFPVLSPKSTLCPLIPASASFPILNLYPARTSYPSPPLTQSSTSDDIKFPRFMS